MYKLNITIPTLNEEKRLCHLLDSIMVSNFPKELLEVYIADADSSDETVNVALAYSECLNLKIISGGHPSVGRNHGARISSSEYIAFIDADVILSDKNILSHCVERLEKDDLVFVTTNLSTYDGNLVHKMYFKVNNLAQRIIGYATGAFVVFNRQKFLEYGGYDENVSNAEDFNFTSKIPSVYFSYVPGVVSTSSRRFKSMGYYNTAKYWLMAGINYKNQEYLYKDKGYWNFKVN